MTFCAIAFLMFALADEPKDTTALVDTAKEAKTKRKASTTKVITNADLKKAKGKLIELPGKPEEPKPVDKVGPIAKHEAAKKSKAEAAARIAAAETKVSDLERELAIIEMAYYDEGDPNVRDTLIRRRFDATKALLEEAKKELAEARENGPSPDASRPPLPQAAEGRSSP